MKRNLLNFLGFQGAWFSCVLGAAAGLPWAGAGAGGALVALHLLLFDRSRAERRLVLGAMAAGWALETANLHLGVAAYADLPFGLALAPAWMAVLWAAFAGTLRHSLGWLRGRPIAAAALGAAAGPLSYAAGERLGALTLGGTGALALLALEWAAAMALLTVGIPNPTQITHGE